MGANPDRGGDERRSRFFLELSEALTDAIGEFVLNREPEIPPAAEHLWEWFWDLHRGRQTGASGYLPLPVTELKAWEAMTGNIVRREEWQIVREMDQVFLGLANARDEEGRSPIRSGSDEISTAAFDAVFG